MVALECCPLLEVITSPMKSHYVYGSSEVETGRSKIIGKTPPEKVSTFSFPWKCFWKPIKLLCFCQMTCEITIHSCGCKKNYVPLLALTLIWWNLFNVKSSSLWKDELVHHERAWHTFWRNKRSLPSTAATIENKEYRFLGMYLKLQMICFRDYSGTAIESHMHSIETLLLEENLYRNSSPT